MNKQKTKTLTTLLLTFICTLSLLFTSLAASSSEGSIPAEETAEVSRVILLGSSRSAAEAERTAESTNKETAITVGIAPATDANGQWERGQSLGNFTITGYCNCSICSGGHSLTYAGTVPKANHTISADLNLFPLGTRLIINGVVYTVEDMGSGVDGRWLDIYYDNHDQAVIHGMTTAEVFSATDSDAP